MKDVWDAGNATIALTPVSATLPLVPIKSKMRDSFTSLQNRAENSYTAKIR
jgi:hypothetical protein